MQRVYEQLVGRAVQISVRGLKERVHGYLVGVDKSRHGRMGNLIVQTDHGDTIVRGDLVVSIADGCEYGLDGACEITLKPCSNGRNPRKCEHVVQVEIRASD